jgi:excinuclease ABC subunit C
MKKAAAAQEFERAADLRDLLADLRRTTEKVNRFERLPYSLPLAIEPENDLAELARILGLPAPPRRIEGFDISNISGTFKVASLVAFLNGRPDRTNYRKFKIKTVEGQDDFASVAEVVRRRYTRLLKESKAGPESGVQSPKSTVHSPESTGHGPQATVQSPESKVQSPENPDRHPEGEEEERAVVGEAQNAEEDIAIPANMPDLILIDGGKGQLSAACAELEKLGLGRIPILGLAKEFEEIHRPGENDPLRLSRDCGALKLLQRVRDESHRLANTYNAELRLRKISESILDEFPNLGPQRKAALLKRFGSLQRIRLASVEQIAEVSGFGGKAAAELKIFLEARQ